ncbi:MAG: hypothetical protein LUP94_03905 [Candidatus Methanomethylicus sp.]|nr:hypothetical protein [Candidatus Methanomethylicus sp.]
MKGSPASILKEDTKVITGKDVQMNNLAAAKTIASVVKSTLGPFGMDKMLVNKHGEAMITNDGAEILKKMEITHPIGKIMVEVAKTQDQEVGDGTTSAVLFSGALLEKAYKLIESGVHGTIIVNGFSKAESMAQEILEGLAIDVRSDDEAILTKIAKTTLNSKGSVALGSDKLAEIAVKTVTEIAQKTGNKVDLKDIRIVKAIGEGLNESEIVMGIVIEGEVDVPNMPKRVEDAKIVLLKHAIDLDRGAVVFAPHFDIEAPEDVKSFVDQEKQAMIEMVSKVTEAGGNVLLCEKAIDMYAVNYLVKHNVLTVRRIDAPDMEQIAKAVGGRLIMQPNEINSEGLGKAEVVEERKFGGKTFIYIMGCKSPTSITIVLRGGEKHVLDEAERSLHDALCTVRNTVEDRKVIAGGCASETELAVRLKAKSLKFKGKEQLAISAYSEALESLPFALAQNAGLDQIDLLLEVKNKHQKEGYQNFGIDVYSGKVTDMSALNVLEPLRVKKQMLKSATEAVNMILKIDDVIKQKPGEIKEEGLEDRLKERSQRIKNKRKWVQTPVEIVK